MATEDTKKYSKIKTVKDDMDLKGYRLVKGVQMKGKTPGEKNEDSNGL